MTSLDRYNEMGDVVGRPVSKTISQIALVVISRWRGLPHRLRGFALIRIRFRGFDAICFLFVRGSGGENPLQPGLVLRCSTTQDGLGSINVAQDPNHTTGVIRPVTSFLALRPLQT